MCEKCKDTGKIVHTYTGNGIKRPFGDGMTIEHTGGSSTELCECRRDLPRRHGKAAWWTFDKGHHETVQLGGIDFCTVQVSITPELPISEDNYPLFRTAENSYFCPSFEVQIDGDPLNSDQLREMGQFLLRMADKADEIDKPVEEPQP